MFYTRADLYYKYSWTVYGNDDPKVTGVPDNVLLNRSEGYEVLPFINKFMERYDLNTVSDGRKIEISIQEKVPSFLRSRENISNWIYQNWQFL